MASGQLLTVRMNRGDATSPWGFRLQGGKDWGTPLAISKVTAGSLAEQAGLQIGDFMIKIGNQSAEYMLHHEAQDAIKQAGNNLDLKIQRGGTLTWKPNVTLVGDVPRPGSVAGTATLTRTSLARSAPESRPIGSGHNTMPKPFANDRKLVHKQFNSPIGLYSEEKIREALHAHSEQLAPGVMGINFMEPDAPVNRQSAVYQAILEEEQNQNQIRSGNYRQHHLSPTNPAPDRRSVSPTPQSGSFRRLEQALSSGEEVKAGIAPQPTRSPSPRPGASYHPSSVIKHVDAPTTRPGQGCSQDSNVNICGQCGGLITGVFCRVKDKNLHPECFKCSTCGTSLKNIGYFNINEKLYCDTHAQQAAMLLSPSSQYEPVAVRPGATIPRDVGILGVGGIPSPASPTPGKTTPHMLTPGGMIERANSPSILGAVPWHHHSPGQIHHVDAPQSPRLFRPSSPIAPPPVAPKPQYKPMSPPNQSLYQSHQPPFGMSVNQTSVPGGSKFTWPPPKKSGSSEFNKMEPFCRPTSGFQPHRPQETRFANANPSPYSSATLPRTNGNSLGNTTISANSHEGTRFVSMNSRRGMGQLRPQAAPGVRVPICTQCVSPIRGPFILAFGKTWCVDHFSCSNSSCRRSLQELGFVEEQGQLYCALCFEAYFAPNCSRCGQKIKEDCLIALEKQWHPECFLCYNCQRSLRNSLFHVKDGGWPYCESCWNQFNSVKCAACRFPIEPSDQWLEALNNNYHTLCFKCSVCNRNLEGESFFAKGGRPICKSHIK